MFTIPSVSNKQKRAIEYYLKETKRTLSKIISASDFNEISKCFGINTENISSQSLNKDLHTMSLQNKDDKISLKKNSIETFNKKITKSMNLLECAIDILISSFEETNSKSMESKGYKATFRLWKFVKNFSSKSQENPQKSYQQAVKYLNEVKWYTQSRLLPFKKDLIIILNLISTYIYPLRCILQELSKDPSRISVNESSENTENKNISIEQNKNIQYYLEKSKRTLINTVSAGEFKPIFKKFCGKTNNIFSQQLTENLNDQKNRIAKYESDRIFLRKNEIKEDSLKTLNTKIKKAMNYLKSGLNILFESYKNKRQYNSKGYTALNSLQALTNHILASSALEIIRFCFNKAVNGLNNVKGYTRSRLLPFKPDLIIILNLISTRICPVMCIINEFLKNGYNLQTNVEIKITTNSSESSIQLLQNKPLTLKIDMKTSVDENTLEKSLIYSRLEQTCRTIYLQYYNVKNTDDERIVDYNYSKYAFDISIKPKFQQESNENIEGRIDIIKNIAGFVKAELAKIKDDCKYNDLAITKIE